ncbi:endonuclease/exonuclease/phosphatase family protein [Massilia sp. LXY-6]|uniref:endonuclease/exonuclease/phosphatase family protein n=1 Tax=Massilia sp. LXY-6 TaxID=3379823 RepID=UPI003F4A6F5E
MLKLLTWNIQSARAPGGGTDLDGVLACLDGFAPDADVLCLQEVACGFPGRDGKPAGDQFAGLVQRLPGRHSARAHAVDTLAPDGGRRRLGSMVFSRHPILQVLRHSLPWPADATPSMPRIALEVTLDTPLGLLRLLNVHLEYFSERQRLAQVGALRSLQREAWSHARQPRQGGPGGDRDSPFAALPRPAPALLLGDFNMLPGSRCHQALLEPFGDGTPPWRDAWPLAHPARAHAPTVGLHDPGGAPCTFDYAFVGNDLASRVRGLHVGEVAHGSDHQPLLLELG